MTNRRINLVLILFFLFGGILASQLFNLQIIKGDFYKALAKGMQEEKPQLPGERGEVFFHDGEPLAINMNWPFVFASPVEIKEKKEVADQIAEALSLEEAEILDKLEKDSFYEIIKKRVTEEEAERIKNLEIKGVYLGKETGRYYPQEELAGQVIGFLGANSRGQYGVEEYYDDVLRGEKNQRGSDIFLTLDYSIQFQAEKLLRQAKDNLNIEGGEIIVIEPLSGEILALANFPSFNPNDYFLVSDFQIFKNRATQELFEPGSVFKPITMACAIEEGKISPDTTYIDEGIVNIGGWPITNYGNRVYGERTMTEVLERSINTGSVFAEKQLGHQAFLQCLDKFGFFQPSGIDIEETFSENKELKRGYEVNFATASFGQGIEITPIQLVSAFTVIANNGEKIEPRLVKKVGENNKIKGKKEKIISPKTASQLTDMMISVVENGFAKSAQIPGYYVAGKTGTSQMSFSALEENASGYSEKTWQSFMGFAPAISPKFVILVKLNNPEAKTAEYSALPIFRDLAKYILDYRQIMPDYQ